MDFALQDWLVHWTWKSSLTDNQMQLRAVIKVTIKVDGYSVNCSTLKWVLEEKKPTKRRARHVRAFFGKAAVRDTDQLLTCFRSQWLIVQFRQTGSGELDFKNHINLIQLWRAWRSDALVHDLQFGEKSLDARLAYARSDKNTPPWPHFKVTVSAAAGE